MQADIKGHTFEVPESPDELNLGTWIEFVRAYHYLDDQAIEIELLPQSADRYFKTVRHNMERAFAVISFLAGMELDEGKKILPVTEVALLYRRFMKCFNVPPEEKFFTWGNVVYILPEPVLHQGSDMTFGEILDAKVMLQNSETEKWSRWELIQMLCAIFIRKPGEAYDETFAHLDGERGNAMLDIPMRGACILSAWWEQLNTFLEETFPVFRESAQRSGGNMKKHFKVWGWVNFLKSMAQEKVFDIPGSGFNSLQCVRITKAFDVLLYASEAKEYNDAYSADLDAKK